MENDDQLENFSQRHFNPDDQTGYGTNSCHYQSPLQRLLDYTMEFHQESAGQPQNRVSEAFHFTVITYCKPANISALL